ncbi:MAG TPA: succinate dehydrogenase assembly factor 2 [Rhodocyclaceae bacterium]|jgi:antitoxin CptB|nr:succinate dehydrogenase assembly factor 2 [Rhodocyclaceae bacterium]
MEDALRIRDDKLRWHCRRALLELDLVFQRFWTMQGDAPLGDDEAKSLERLLELEDHPLWKLVSDDTMSVHADDMVMLERLRRL